MSLAKPTFLQVNENYVKHKVGSSEQSYMVADISDYDFYILAGVSKNELFSKLVMMNMNIPVGCAFDSSITEKPMYFPDNMRIMSKNVSAMKGKDNINLKYFIERYNDIFLKMDVHGAEYLWFLSLSTDDLMSFKQIVVSFYDVNNNPTKNRALNKINCFTKLSETHDVVAIDSSGPVLNVTYVRKDSQSAVEFSDDSEPEPVAVVEQPEPELVAVVEQQEPEPVAVVEEQEPEQVAVVEPVTESESDNVSLVVKESE